MLDKVSTSPRKRTMKWLGAAAVAALIAGGAVESGLVAPNPAHAELRSMAQPIQNVPSFADVIDQVKPAVVAVKVKVQNVADRNDDDDDGQQFSMPDLPPGHPMERFFRQFRDQMPGRGERGPRQERPRQFGQSLGSGFFISADGYVVTNNHVVDKGSEVTVTMDNGKELSAKVIGTDPKTDLALLKVDGGNDFPYVRLAGQKARIGDWVMAIGNPFGLGGTVTAGIVSAQHRDIGSGPYDDYIQIDASVNKGNSGGPTFNLSGEVVGVNTAIFSPSGGNVGIAFAIPASTVESVVASLKDKGSVTRGFIGVQMQPVTKEIAEAIGLKEPKGALVADAVKDGPAAKAGVKTGDTIIAVDGQPIKEAKDLSRKVANVAPGKTLSLTLWREGKERTVTLEVASQPKGV
ncbi:S1C family serine protease [Microvirga terrestris]|uniref:Probable periplasmic serine endoprotease DegP-like n=1 Tax=Microvirga terrestris TaxID=2791024 RepID=A0ABS0HP06_9HYPH|nr:trypsin-like peptidase domain-containing protein [Microvirga terrestris]MBF9195209.1 trypsin-like peptidase domain-containing protein [Microvirga terrestris]